MAMCVRTLSVLFTVVLTFTTLSFGQISSTAPLSGVVFDPTGAVVPGVAVTVRNNATNAQFETLSIENGTFTIPALTPGTYTVTAALAGFKQAVASDVKIDAGTPATVRLTLQVGDVTETVAVEAGAEILQTQTATVSTTIDVRQVMQLPVSRNALEFTTLLPGFSQTGNYRTSRVNGLSRDAVNITIDGINTQEYLKDTDFFTYISPRTDAIEEVTVSTAAPGAESSGQGGVQVKMVTKQGSNEYHGGLYYYGQNTSLNSNSWFNNRDLPADPKTGKAPRPRIILNQYGFKIGGPITIPKVLNGRDRAFFFINFEEIRQPSAVTRNRDILHPRTQQGIFRYGSGTPREVDLLAMARANGHTSTIDPVVGKLLADIRNATQSTGGIRTSTEPNEEIFRFTNRSQTKNRYPTIRLDFNLTQNHHLETSYWYQRYNTFPDTLNSSDPTFPGFPNVGGQSSDRFVYSLTLRSTLSSHLVNEARFGFTGGSVRFSPERSAEQFLGSVANQTGFDLQISAAGIANATAGRTTSNRNSPITSYSDTLNWQRGAHNLGFGANLTQANTFVAADTIVPQIQFGVDSTDPANTMFTAANFPGASATDLNNARSIYAVLTGRVTAINGNALVDEKTGEFVYLGPDFERGRQREFGFHVQDSWRARTDLTLNYGLRWEVQRPYVPLNGRYTTTTVDSLYGISGPGNLFKPGVMTGKPTEMVQLKQGEPAYGTQWGNVAPSFGFAWSPSLGNPVLKAVLGESTVLRGGYSIAYIRRSNSLFNDGYDQNPGSLLTLNRTIANGNLVSGQGSDRLPVLLRETSRLGPPPFPPRPTFPSTNYLVSDDVRIFEPDFKVPYVQSWTLGIQREFGNNTALEVRYVGNRGLQNAETVDLNEINLLESRFMDEFKSAMANMQANIAAGRGNTFRYFGPGTGTNPLATILAYFSGVPTSQAGDPSRYTSTLFSSTTFLNSLAAQNPRPTGTTPNGFYQDLTGDATRRANAIRAGLPANLFVVNPGLDDVEVIRNGGYSNYHSLVVELRRRLSSGLSLNSSYVWSKTQTDDFISLRKPRANRVPTTNVPHVFKANWLYELPVGNGRALFGGASGFVDKLVGGWEFHGVTRIQAGDPINIGNVRLVGMTRKDLQNALQVRFDDANRKVFSLPDDIISNTIRANNVSATSANGFGTRGAPAGRYIAPANGPGCIELYDGDCGSTSMIVYGPRYVVFDLTVAKRIKLTENTDFEFRAEMYNVFNNTNFNLPGGLGTRSAATYGEITAAEGARAIQLIGRINF